MLDNFATERTERQNKVNKIKNLIAWNFFKNTIIVEEG